MTIKFPQFALTLLVGISLQGASLSAQDIFSGIADNSASASFRILPTSVLNEDAPLFSIVRNVEEKDFQGALVEDALSFNLGLQINPIEGLSVRADAWGLQIDDATAASVSSND